MASIEKHPDRRYLYVCEGITDEDKLKKLGCFFVITTGGLFVRPEIKTFLKACHEVRDIVFVLDPDGPGKKIRAVMEEIIGPCLHIDVKKKLAIQKNKVGIAQMGMEDLKEYLRPFINHDLFVDENLSFDEDTFYDLGLVGPGSKEKRMKLIEKFSIPYTSAKKVEDCLWMLGIDRKMVEEVLHDGA